MPNATIGEQTNLDSGSLFLRLTTKDQQFQIRFIRSDYYYDGKHFEQTVGGWNVTDCPRINDENHCTICEKYFELTEPVKELKKEIKDLKANASEDHPDIAKLEKQIEKIFKAAEPYKVKITFYYAVLERGERASHKARIFQTSMKIRKDIEQLQKMNQPILGRDFIVCRTQTPGNYYTLTAIDSKDTPELTEDETKEMNKAAQWVMSDMVNGKQGSGNLAQNPFDEEDIPTPEEEK